MRQAGFVDPNVKTVRASMRQLAIRADVHTSTVAAMMFGDRAPKHATITAVAKALGIDVRTVAGQVGQTRTEREPYAMPDEVHLLSGRVQVAITQLIRAIAEERDGDGRESAPISGTGVRTPAGSTDTRAEPVVRQVGASVRRGAKRSRSTPRGDGTAESTTL